MSLGKLPKASRGLCGRCVSLFHDRGAKGSPPNRATHRLRAAGGTVHLALCTSCISTLRDWSLQYGVRISGT